LANNSDAHGRPGELFGNSVCGMKGISMLTREGIAVNTWVSLDSSCSVEPHVSGDELQVEFGSGASSLRLVITEEMVDRLAGILADAKARFQELDEQVECGP
jgi:hypothetical protein